MKFTLLLLLLLKQWTSTQGKVIWHKESPIKKRVGECVTLYAKSAYKITNPGYTWTKDTLEYKPTSSDVVIRDSKLEINYAKTTDTAYYTATVQTSIGTEITEFWLTVKGCEVNESEDREDHDACSSSCKEVCSPDWILFKGNCWRYYKTSKTWDSALSDCQREGALLAVINDKEENAFAGSLLHSAVGAWIGLNDRRIENEFVWNHDKDSNVKYTAWDNDERNLGQPDNYNYRCNFENCLHLTHSGGWNDATCISYFYFICQKPWREVTFSATQTNWKCLGSMCYHMPTDQLASWAGAHKICSSTMFNASLAHISSDEENNFVQNMKGKNKEAWIGITDTLEAGLYKYTDGDSVTYFNWAPGEPNDIIYKDFKIQCPGEDCVAIQTSLSGVTWRDDSCTLELPYICKIEKVSFLTMGQWVAIGLGCFALAAILVGVVVVKKVKDMKIRSSHKPKD